jgi:hypothetical protein
MSTHIVSEPARQGSEAPAVPFDLYREVHKGLRFALFDLTVAVGRADCRASSDRTEVIARTNAVIRLLHAHHGHEDAFIRDLIEIHAPALAAIVDEGHLETDQDLLEIELLVERLATCAPELRVAVGLDLYRYLALFAARYVAHMALEEGSVMEALRDAMTFDELFAVEIAIRSSVAPPLMVEFMAVMLPAMTPDERTDMLGGMQAGAPAEIFELFRSAAETILSADEYAVIAARIGVA